MVDETKKKQNNRLSSASKASSPAIAEANGAKRSAEIDPNMSNHSKRKRESEPVRKQNSKKNRKSEKYVAESASPENNSPSAIAVQIPPTPSQPTPSKPKPKSSAKKAHKQNGEELKSPVSSIPQPTPDLPATKEPPAVTSWLSQSKPQLLTHPTPRVAPRQEARPRD
jgi:hypothetical protein